MLPSSPGLSLGLVACTLAFALCAGSASAVRVRVPTAEPPALFPTSAPIDSSDSLELSEDKDFLYDDLLDHHSVVCPKPMCECRHVGSGGIAAKCKTLDLQGQRFQGVVNHFEVSDASETVGGLYLTNHTLSSLGLKFLTTVKIANSSIKALNVSTFNDLPDLYDVSLADNRIMLLHPNMFLKNTQLRKLSLAGNPLRVSQLVLGQLGQLGQHGQLGLPAPGPGHSYLLNSPSLMELDLSRCELDFLSPHTFSRMPHLEHLWLAGNKLITLERDTLRNLELLEELDLSDNRIAQISTEMFEANTELTELHLRKNSLQTLKGVEILGLDTLDISQNTFENIEEMTFNGFPDLTRLNISDNAVQKIHPRAFENLKNLQFLDLSGNDIEGPLPRELFAQNEVLETLNLSDNPKLGQLPAGGFSGQFSALYQLDLSYVGLSSLDESSFLGMDHLSTLHLQGNNISELKPGVLRRLSQLVSLDLSDNHLTRLDVKTFQTNGFLRHLDLSGNPLMTVSPQVFTSTPYLKWLDLSRCHLTSLWQDASSSSSGQNVLRKLGHLNVAGNRIQTLRVSEIALTGDLVVLDISNNPLKCTKELRNLMDWLVKHAVAPRSEQKLSGILHNDLLPSSGVMEGTLRSRWAGVYDALCGQHAYDTERANIQKNILASPSDSDTSALPLPVSQADLDDMNFVLGNKNLIMHRNEDEDGVSDGEDADSEDADSEDADDEDSEDDSTVEDADDEDDDDDDDEEYDDDTIVSPGYNSTDYSVFSHRGRGSPYFWPIITISVAALTTVLIIVNAVVCCMRRSRARRHARYQAPMFRHIGHIPANPKSFGGIPGSFIKTKKDGGFVYKKLYEETTTPNPPIYFPQPRTFRFPLDPSDLQTCQTTHEQASPEKDPSRA